MHSATKWLEKEAEWCRHQLEMNKMSLEEALIIAQRMEEDGVCGPVGLALRLIYAEYLKLKEKTND